MVRTLKNNPATALLFIFTLFLIILSFVLIPYSDSYYYWDWSRHLDLGYFDGPPLIAYAMRLFTSVFGHYIFSINFLGVTTIIFTAFYIYQSTQLLCNKKAELNAVLLWMLSTPVFHYLFLWVTYDNVLCLFWSATIYHVVRFIKFSKNFDLYATSISLSLMLLSKYTGIILVIAIFIFIMSTHYRYLFREKHFYFAAILSFAILSPHLYWSYKHHWQSFFYLVSHHLHTGERENVYQWIPAEVYPCMLKAGAGMGEEFMRLGGFFIKILKTYDVLLILPLYASLRGAFFATWQSKRLFGLPRRHRRLAMAGINHGSRDRHNNSLFFLQIIQLTFLIFLFLISFKNSISKHWLTPFTMSAAILTSYYFEKLQFKKLFIITIFLYTMWGFYYLTVNCVLQRYFDEDFFRYRLIQKAGKTHPEKHIVTSDWETAAKLSFWMGETKIISTLPCGNENQYAEWSKTLPQDEILYLDFKDRSACIKKYFTTCEKLSSTKKSATHIGYLKKNPPIELFTYRCGKSHNPPPIKI